MEKSDSRKKSIVFSDKRRYTENMGLSLTNDVIFKYVFGATGSEGILKSLINAVLTDSGFTPVAEVKLKNHHTPQAPNWAKGTILDILAEDEQGIKYDIEMQISSEPNFANRSLFYWAREYSSQLIYGDEYTELKPVICINLIDFILVKNPEIFHSCYMLMDKNIPDAVLTEDLQMHFVELPKAVKFSGKLSDWARLLVTSDEFAPEETMEVLLKKDGSIKEAYGRYRKCLQNEEAYIEAMLREKWQRDQLSRKKYAERQLEEGLKQGMQKGIEQGIEQGMKEKAIQDAKNLKDLGVSPEIIAKATGLSSQEIERL